MGKNESWKEEAWETFLVKFWDKRPKDVNTVIYTTKDLEPILAKYTKSGQGEIRIFHSGHGKIKAVKKRNIIKIPLTRESWMITNSPPKIYFLEPTDLKEIGIEEKKLTDGMIAGIQETLNESSNPGETTLLAIANHTGVISDFYGMKENGVLFTGGRQKAGIHLIVGVHDFDMSQAQIEIDGGFEWTETVVVVEMKSSFKQKDFDINQALLPMLKWRTLLKDKKVQSLVLFAETKIDKIEYWAYDLEQDNSISPLGMKITRNKKYIVKIT
ncbi:MAG: hypothetical protein NT098_04640 [Candidatus Parcubacteria bacterium]|nr:hypothetical protein [Candidatus Parcubacteria bacterium]